MAHGQVSVGVLGLLMLASPVVAQRADLTNLERAPNDRTTLVTSSEWALQAAKTDLRDPLAPTTDEPGFTVKAVRQQPEKAAIAAHAASLVDHMDRWSRWRRRHQFRVRTSHQQRRLRLHEVRLGY